ncbi:RDD family protein [Micromonospora sp. WMMD714]|uniref:RDD family protein n=1 Tax=Micromonospora sp. WMMD714 TaxID=3016097 RepID=UPI00249C0179|nr:RDD family protein [Micromonospora sp. WMMD714]WFE64081.1 RDD family protein [Micromonospora sp. WMMD714]
MSAQPAVPAGVGPTARGVDANVAGGDPTDRVAALGAAGGDPTGRTADAGLVSGEAVELDVRAARLGSRVLALLIDVVGQALCAALLALTLTPLVLILLPDPVVDRAFTGALETLGLVLVLVGYPVIWERLNHGRTPGKLAVGLRVVDADGGPVGMGQSLTRALVGVAVEWPGLVLPLLSWAAGATVMLTDPRGRRLGDLVAGTMVVHTRSAQSWRPAPQIIPPLSGWAVTLDLTRLDDALALAVRQYLVRGTQLVEPYHSRLGRQLWREVGVLTSPAPPPGVPEPLLLAAVLAERNRRGALRLRRHRAVTAALWPDPTAVGPSSATVGPSPATVGMPPATVGMPPIATGPPAPAGSGLRPASPGGYAPAPPGPDRPPGPGAGWPPLS